MINVRGLRGSEKVRELIRLGRRVVGEGVGQFNRLRMFGKG